MARDSAECSRLAIVEGEYTFINFLLMLIEEAMNVKARGGSRAGSSFDSDVGT